MSDTAFTPGPWFFRLYPGGADLMKGPEGDDGGSIFEGGFTLASNAENEANARLIASAPDMYNALLAAKNLCANINEFGHVTDSIILAAAEITIAKALSRARGEPENHSG